MKKLFTSESVTEGHPDKVCDQISDAILDAMLKQDADSRSACEVVATTGMVLVMGEIRTKAQLDVTKIVRDTICKIGYNDGGFDGKTCAVLVALDEQSPDIAQGVNKSLEVRTGVAAGYLDETGAGDQGMMFGYACNETPVLMPLAIMLSHALTRRLTHVRKAGILPYLKPDGKAQVTVEYENGEAKRVDTVVVSTQHAEDVDIERVRADILKFVVQDAVSGEYLDENTKIYINPTGRFVVGGPQGDSGLTGRKIIVDTYGGYAPHGGGSFSGKDPTKVDRSAAYFARYVAKNIVAAGLAAKCEIQVAYAIGKARPVSVAVNTFGTGTVSDAILSAKITTVFDFRPRAIIEHLRLSRPIYTATAAYGHFGRAGFPWEETDMTDELQAAFSGNS